MPVVFDPERVRFDLSRGSALSLTSVRSIEEFRALQEGLREMRGQSYFLVNILKGRARLILTVITADELEVTATYELDPGPLGIADEEMLLAGPGGGNHPLTSLLEARIREATQGPLCPFFAVRRL